MQANRSSGFSNKVKRFFVNKINTIQAPNAKSEVFQRVTSQDIRSYVMARMRTRGQASEEAESGSGKRKAEKGNRD